MDIDTLNAIDIKHRGDPGRCLRQMIAERLESSDSLTWKDLCNSLRTVTVKRNDVAKRIECQIGEFK